MNNNNNNNNICMGIMCETQRYLVSTSFIHLFYTIRNANTNTIFHNLKIHILPLHQFISNRIVIMLYKYANDMLPSVMIELFIAMTYMNEHSARQRHNLVYSNRGSTVISYIFCDNVVLQVWNALHNNNNLTVSIYIYLFKQTVYTL